MAKGGISYIQLIVVLLYMYHQVSETNYLATFCPGGHRGSQTTSGAEVPVVQRCELLSRVHERSSDAFNTRTHTTTHPFASELLHKSCTYPQCAFRKLNINSSWMLCQELNLTDSVILAMSFLARQT